MVVVVPISLTAHPSIVVVNPSTLMTEASAALWVPRRVATAVWVSIAGGKVFGFNITSSNIVSEFCTTGYKVLFNLGTRNGSGEAQSKECGQEEGRLEKHYGQFSRCR